MNKNDFHECILPAVNDIPRWRGIKRVDDSYPDILKTA
jgi:hypothetical protein